MNLLETILQANGGQNVRQMASKLGLENDQAESAIRSLLPALTTGLQRNMAAPGGLEGLLSALQRGDHTKYVDRPETLTRSETIEDGNGILGHILGSKDVSRRLAGRASERTGVDTGILKQMLPLLATMVMGSMSRQASQSGLDRVDPRAVPQQDAMGMLGSLLDADKDGSVVDDLFGMAKKFLG
jgi:hypothetical protein